jgi:hypothetical protein
MNNDMRGHPTPLYMQDCLFNHDFQAMEKGPYCVLCEMEIAYPGIFDWRG